MSDSKMPTFNVSAARRARIAGAGVQAVEGNPLTDREIEMFELFEREAWPHDRRRAHILSLVGPVATRADRG